MQGCSYLTDCPYLSMEFEGSYLIVKMNSVKKKMMNSVKKIAIGPELAIDLGLVNLLLA
jgi:hypothetical protein